MGDINIVDIDINLNWNDTVHKYNETRNVISWIYVCFHNKHVTKKIAHIHWRTYSNTEYLYKYFMTCDYKLYSSGFLYMVHSPQNY